MVGEENENGEIIWVSILGMKSCIAYGHLNNGRPLLCAALDAEPMVNYSNAVGNI